MRIPKPPTPETYPIGYLMQIKFPGFPYEDGSIFYADSTTKEFFANRNQRAEKLFQELSTKSPAELQELCRAEIERQIAARIEKAKQEEEQRFFNQSSANVDLSYWAKMSHWSLDEAVAISLGKNPKVVNWENVKPSINVSAFAAEYERRRSLTLRAVPWKRLFEPVLPGFFLAWAKGLDI